MLPESDSRAEELPMDGAQTYRIGAVARLTGIAPDTLRVWERRYQAVQPIRTDGGIRLYGAEDVGRLCLIKRLIDKGDAIGHVARLPLALLRERLEELPIGSVQRGQGVCRVVVLGAKLAPILRAHLADAADGAEERVEFVGFFDDEQSWQRAAVRRRPDLLLIERPTLQADQVSACIKLFAVSGARRALVVYEFAHRAALDRLETAGLDCKRVAYDPAQLLRWCETLHGGSWPRAADEVTRDLQAGVQVGSQVPPRRFDDASLARVASASPSLRCECPHHLVSLISTLAAFEAYSLECEHGSPEDAAVHALLHASSAHARATMEEALARLLEIEGEAHPPGQGKVA